MRLFISSLLIFCLSFTLPLQAAQEKAKTLPEVLVKSKKMQKSLTVPTVDSAKESAKRVPGGTDVVAADDYKTGRASTLQDVLGYSPGVFVQPRFGSDEARVSIRGSGLQRTFHLRGIKLLQDGVPINEADGGGDFQAIDPLALQYTEVYRGANALQYGATTLGGAINFVSPTGYDAPLIQGRIEGGSYGYLRSQISSGEVIGPVDYYVSLSQSRQHGFRGHAHQDAERFFGNFGLRIGEHAENRFYVTLVDTDSKLPGSLTKGQMWDNPHQANVSNVTGNQKRDFDYIRLANKTAFRWDDQLLELGAFWFQKDLFHPIFQLLEIFYNNAGGSIRYQNFKELLGHKNILTLGFNPVFGTAKDLRYLNAGGSRGRETAGSHQSSYNLDLYGENLFYILPQLAIVTGGQLSFASRKTEDQFLSDGNHDGHPTYQAFSPKVGVLYDLTERSQVFANYSRSFEPPSFGELANRTGGGIADLTEQKGDTFEIGTRGHEGPVNWDFAYYFSSIQNELLSLNDGRGNPLGTINAYETRHQGVEFGAGVDVLRGLIAKNEDTAKQDKVTLRGIYNWSRFAFHRDPIYAHKALPGIPEHFTRAELIYEHPSGIYFGPNLEWSMKEYPVDMANSLFADPYVIFGAKAGYKVDRGLSVFIEGKNLTNKTYAATTGVIADAQGRDSAQFLPGDGIGVFSGVEFKWG